MLQTAKSLEDLMAAMKSGADLDWTDLPIFGGDEPASTHGVWSWDEQRLLVGRCADELEIIPRSAAITADPRC